MVPKAFGMCASIGLMSLGALSLGACTSTPHSYHAGHFRAPLFSKPPEADAYRAVLIARYAALNNDPAEAVAQYAAVLDTLEAGDPIATRGVFAALMSGNFKQAVAFAKKAGPDAEGRSSLSDLTLAVDALARGNEQSASAYLAADRFGPFNRSMATNLSAWMALESEGLTAAEAILQESHGDEFAVHSVTLAMRGLIQLSAREDRAALATFAELDAIGPRLAIATHAQASLLASMGDIPSALERIEAFQAEVGPNPELDALQADIAANAKVYPPRYTLAEGTALGLYAPAAALAARSESELPGVYFALALHLDPEMDAARTLWADNLDKHGRGAAAIAVLQHIPRSSPFYAVAQGQRAWAVARNGNMAQAIEIARTGVDETGDRNLTIQYGDLLVTQGNDLAADRVFSRLIERDAHLGKQDWRLLFARGAVRERLGNWDDAEVDLIGALELAPDNPDVMNHLGFAWVDRQHNLDAAVPMLERAAALRPKAGHIADSLGWAYFQVGRYGDAIAELERAVALSPTSVNANDHLGDAYWRSGRHLEATFQWQRALELQPVEAVADRIRNKLVAGLPPRPAELVGAALTPGDRYGVQSRP